MSDDSARQYLPRGEYSLSRLSIRGVLRLFWYRLRGLRPVRVGSCLQCGACCRELHLFHCGRWISSEKQFRRMLKDCPEYARFEPIEDDGPLMLFRCRYLAGDNICLDYANRPRACVEYPSMSMFLRHGNLHENCGYTFKAVKDFSGSLKKARQVCAGPEEGKKG
jgi:Fe-S-cluster containining protein